MTGACSDSNDKPFKPRLHLFFEPVSGSNMALMMEWTSVESRDEASDRPGELKVGSRELPSKKEDGRDWVFRPGFCVWQEPPRLKLELDLSEISERVERVSKRTWPSSWECAYQRKCLRYWFAEDTSRYPLVPRAYCLKVVCDTQDCRFGQDSSAKISWF